MERVPFSEKELIPIGSYPPFAGRLGATRYQTPISPRENFLTLKLSSEEDPLWLPITDDYFFCTGADFLEDSIARFSGGKDFFGVNWTFEPVIGAACAVGGNPILKDANDWEKVLTFPDVDAYPWKKVERDPDEDRPLTVFILSGFFERMIALMDFQYAAMAFVDEDQKDAVKAFFDRLVVFYNQLIDKFVEYLPCDMVEIHDDWGSQAHPFFSLDTVMEMVVPYFKRVVDHAHEKGLLVEFHSCGFVEPLVPGYIATGADWWAGQNMNNYEMLYEKYGSQIRLSPYPPFLPDDATDEEVYKAAEEFCDKYVGLGKPKIIAHMLGAHPKMREALYVTSRKKLNP